MLGSRRRAVLQSALSTRGPQLLDVGRAVEAAEAEGLQALEDAAGVLQEALAHDPQFPAAEQLEALQKQGVLG